MKNSKLNLSVAILLASVILGAFYFATQSSKQKFYFSMKEKCADLGSKAYNQAVQELGTSTAENYYDYPEYHYSKELNTCLYMMGNTKNNNLFYYVKDSVTQEVLVSYLEFNVGGEKRVLQGKKQCPTCVSSYEEFEVRKQELFTK